MVELDIEVTPELAAEGTARDIVRMVQQARKDAGFDVTDRIHLELGLTQPLAAAVGPHRAYVAEQVLAVRLEISDHSTGSGLTGFESTGTVDGEPVAITVTQVRHPH